MFTSTKVVLSLTVFVALLTGCNKDAVVAPPVDDPNYTNANGINGGRLYDKFWATETGFNQADANLTRYNQYADFFRCKQCHGWDLLGRGGSYINRGPRTTRPNVANLDLLQIAKTKSYSELFTLIKTGSSPSIRRAVSADLSTYAPTTNSTIGDQMPNYSQSLTDEHIWDLVKFLKTEVIDINNLYDFTTSGTYPTGSITYANIGKGGTAAAGNTYMQNCTGCHGTNGRLIIVDGSFSVGSHLRAKPYEVQHKVKFGQLGSGMQAFNTTLQQMKDLYKALTDTAMYPRP